MAIVRCERCSEPSDYLEVCDSCNKRVCRKCVKSSRRATKHERRVICKDCWTSVAKRKKFKEKVVTAANQPEEHHFERRPFKRRPMKR